MAPLLFFRYGSHIAALRATWMCSYLATGRFVDANTCSSDKHTGEYKDRAVAGYCGSHDLTALHIQLVVENLWNVLIDQ